MKPTVLKWIRHFWGKFTELVLTFGITVILYTGILYLVSFLWIVYLDTPTGQRFITLHYVDTALIDSLRQQNFLIFSLRISLIVMSVCLVLGVVSQLLALVRYFYDGRGFFSHLILWGIPSAAFSTLAINGAFETGWVALSLLGFLPVVALFNGCLRFTSELLPEVSPLFRSTFHLVLRKIRGERRSEPRYDVSLPVAYSPASLPVAYYGPKTSGIYQSTARQISDHGFCLLEPKDVSAGDTIKFKLRVENEPLLGEAEIRWTKGPDASDDEEEAPSSKAGCLIMSMSRDHEIVLKTYLRKQSLAKA